MAELNWGLAGNGFQNALALGLQLGERVKQQRADSALSDYVVAKGKVPSALPSATAGGSLVATPEQQAQTSELEQRFATLAKRNPEIAMRIRAAEQQESAGLAKTQQEQEARRLQAAAAQGDKVAMAQLAGIDFDAWAKLDSRSRDVAKERSGVLANAALDVLKRPPEQRAAAWDSYIGQLSQDMPELAQYQGKYSEEAARSVVAQGEMIGKLHEQEQPSYQVIPQGGVLVNTRDPQAIQSYAQGSADVPPPPPGFQLEGGPTQPASGSF